MKQTQYNYFTEPDRERDRERERERERKPLVRNVIIPISYSSLYDSLEK